MFKTGDWIRFKYTGQRAEIIEDHLDGSYTVWFEEDEEEGIAFADDIVPENQFKGRMQSKAMREKQIKNSPSTEDLFYSKKELDNRRIDTLRSALNPSGNHTSIKKETVEETPETRGAFPLPQLQEIAPKDSGIFIAILQTDWEEYTIYLTNDTPHSIGFQYELKLKETSLQNFKKVIPPHTFFAIGSLSYQQFLETPTLWWRSVALQFEKKIKLKYTKLLQQYPAIPLMGIEGFQALLFKQLPSKTSHQDELRAHLKQQQTHTKKKKTTHKRNTAIEQHAAFERSIDLHIEKLVSNPKKLNRKDLLSTQLSHFRYFISQAIQLEIPSVHVIHGLGDGILKSSIHEELKKHPQVKKFKNEYHPRYGFGATEVVFK